MSGISQDGACTDLLENLSVNNLKGDLSTNSTSFNQPLFSLANTFNVTMFRQDRNYAWVPQHQLTVKDVVIILIVFSLWIYSLHLVYRSGDSHLLANIYKKNISFQVIMMPTFVKT